MAYFTDKEGNNVEVITPDNLSEFLKFVDSKAYLNDNGRGAYEDLQTYTFQGLDVSDILREKNGALRYFSEEGQKYLGKVIANSLNPEESEKAELTTKILLDNAKDFPHILNAAFYFRGGSNPIFDATKELMEKRNISENLPALIVLNEAAFLPVGQVDKDSKPNGAEIRLFEQLCEKEGYRGTATLSSRLITSGFFANAKLSPKAREFHNAVYFSGYYNNESTLKDKVLNMSVEFLDKQTIASLAFGNHWYEEKVKDANGNNTGMYTAASKKIEEALMYLTEQVEPHDKANQGRIKTLNQRFKEMIVDLWDGYEGNRASYRVKPTLYENLPGEAKTNVVHELYKKTAMYDIQNGKTEDLDNNALQAVLNDDARGYWFSKISPEIIEKRGLIANNLRQSSLRAISSEDINPGNAVAFTVLPKLSLEERKAALEKIATNVENTSERKQYLLDIQKANDDFLVLTNKRDQLHQAIVNAVELRNTYKLIEEALDSDKHGDAEQHLSKEAINKWLENAANGKFEPLQMPEYGRLPIFSRAKEEKRRSDMEWAIDKINSRTENMFDPKKHEYYAESLNIMKDYSSLGLLNDKTFEQMIDDLEAKDDGIAEAKQAYVEKYGLEPLSGDIGQIELKDILQKEDAVAIAREKLHKKEADMHQQAKDNVLPKEGTGIDPLAERSKNKGQKKGLNRSR